MTGRIVNAAGPVIRAVDLGDVAAGEILRVGSLRLLGEVLSVDGEVATVQVYEETTGLRVGDAVEATGRPMLAQLGPGLLGNTYDGLQRPLG
ncbi:MAG TPA: V-type ATP synthase subunit A, partial [Candidatus Limnocylindria bacterium]